MGRAEKTKSAKFQRHQTERSGRRQLVLFLILFVVYAGILFAISYFWKSGMESLQVFTAGATAFLLRLFGYPVISSGTLCMGGPLAIQIIPECTGVFETVILSAVVLAYPAPWKKRLIGVAAGIAILFVLNLLRLLILGIIGFHSQETMEWVHLYLWQFTLILFVVGLFFAWLSWARPRTRVLPPPDPTPGQTGAKGKPKT